jgi:hypothetical protein
MSGPQIVVGTFQSSMPSKVVAKLWHSDQYLKSKDSFHKKGGALFGSLLILAAFSSIVAITNKDLTFLLFSAWLITGLRVAAINGGWDATWLGASLRNDLYLLILRSTVAGYGFFTVAIFQTLFLKNDTDLFEQYSNRKLKSTYNLCSFGPLSLGDANKALSEPSND